MVESTFQLGRGLGPAREKKLWSSGVARWSEVGPTETKLRAAIDQAALAYQARHAHKLASLIPSREHWRLFETFSDDAAYLDIETSDDVVGFAGISAIGFYDRRGPRLLLGGRDLQLFPELAREWKLLITFNGLSFDVPVLRRAFPEWEPPLAHIDLRHLLARLGLEGGLKAIERRLPMLYLRRPAHLDGIGGWDACWLYRRGREGDRDAMRRFAQYNLYDAINLRTLMAWAYNQMVERIDAPAVRAAAHMVMVPGRGDVLYDVSKILAEI